MCIEVEVIVLADTTPGGSVECVINSRVMKSQTKMKSSHKGSYITGNSASYPPTCHLQGDA